MCIDGTINTIESVSIVTVTSLKQILCKYTKGPGNISKLIYINLLIEVTLQNYFIVAIYIQDM